MKRLNGNFSIKTGYWIIFVKKKWPMAVAVANHCFSCRAVRIAAMPAIAGILEAVADKGV